MGGGGPPSGVFDVDPATAATPGVRLEVLHAAAGAPAGAPFSSGLSAMTASVVRNSAAIDAAFCSADRVTLAASMMPALVRSS